ncbi:glycosyltransferase [Methyloversatilis thermotolerans]|uniref:glycosyltransferase n=1 Tax=Methyloversatilis thermotolerans TaxID=1346290 RepID=UPI0003826EA5|nr:glycosyltransferase [Methyloversatilis thermotolerans]
MRVLILAEGATLAHVGRPLMVAEELSRRGHEVLFCRPDRYGWIANGGRFECIDLAAQSPEVFAQRLARGQPLYDFATLEAYVAADRELIRAYRPDIVVGDFRLSLAVSARLDHCPYATLSNAYWSPYYRLPDGWPVPDLPLTRAMPIPLARALFNLARPLAFAMHARAMRRLRREHGLPADVSLQQVYTDADLVCYCDMAEVFALNHAPPHHRIVGPLAWSPAVSRPECWDRLRDGEPTAYVTLGSSGRAELVAPAVNALVDEGFQVILSSAGRSGEVVAHPRVLQSDMVPGSAACALADLVVCNGGSPTTQQALRAGKPVIGIPGNLDQFLNMEALLRNGLGRVVRSDRFSSAKLREAVRHLDNERRAAARLAGAGGRDEDIVRKVCDAVLSLAH